MAVMKLRSYVVSFLFFLLGFGHLIACPSSVVVIGGGPTGLGAAIEARQAGAEVILVEKRDEYTRHNTLFLYPVALDLFEKWNAQIPLMEPLELKGERRGFVLIKDLETSLALRADALGIQRIHGEFIDFVPGSQSVIIHTAEGEKFLSYDLLVGADGVHSRVREKLGIDCHALGESIGGIAMVPGINLEKNILIDIQPHAEVFVKKVCIPSATILFLQYQPRTSVQTLVLSDMIRFSSEVGWQEEAKKMEAGSLLTMESIPICLQRATAFSDSGRGVILLGDAAGAASFYQGKGANFSFKTIQLAGKLFQSWPHEQAYEQFHHDMEVEVGELIKTSLPLFE